MSYIKLIMLVSKLCEWILFLRLALSMTNFLITKLLLHNFLECHAIDNYRVTKERKISCNSKTDITQGFDILLIKVIKMCYVFLLHFCYLLQKEMWRSTLTCLKSWRLTAVSKNCFIRLERCFTKLSSQKVMGSP